MDSKTISTLKVDDIITLEPYYSFKIKKIYSNGGNCWLKLEVIKSTIMYNREGDFVDLLANYPHLALMNFDVGV